MMMMPVGFRFQPTDEELVGFYLLNKVRGEDMGWDGIREIDIYGEKAPWEFCGGQEKLYIFTRLKRLSKNRVARTAGGAVYGMRILRTKCVMLRVMLLGSGNSSVSR
jgi:hypothetical protein